MEDPQAQDTEPAVTPEPAPAAAKPAGVAAKVKNTLSNSKILGNLDKASYIELFYDLVFIVCMRSIFPLLSEAQEMGDVYTYYTFAFTFMLMMQVWFSSTMLMNRCATGDKKDTQLLIVNMFLIFCMAKSISLNLEHLIAYNVSWILINLNMIFHWRYRLRLLGDDPDPFTVGFVKRIMIVMGVQSVLVLVSLFLPFLPAQVLTGVALVLGFVGWINRAPLDERGREHLVERCALLLILTFGETIIGIDSIVKLLQAQGYQTFICIASAAIYFCIVVAMFAVYRNEIEHKLDIGKVRTGNGYIAVSAVVTFLLANVNASFDMVSEGTAIFGIQGSEFMSLAISLFLLSFFLFAPYNKEPLRKSTGRTVLRVVLCLIVAADVVTSPIMETMIYNVGYDTTSIALAVSASIAALVLDLSCPILFARLDYLSMVPRKARKR